MLSEDQINEILKEVSEKPFVSGILLTGSYVYGNPNEESDLDIRIITNDGSNIDDRNSEKFGVRIEAFYNSPEQIRNYFQDAIESGDEPSVHFWANGKITYDPEGIVLELQNEAKRIWEKGPKNGKWKTRAEYLAKHG